jgi:hypothetical protein
MSTSQASSGPLTVSDTTHVAKDLDTSSHSTTSLDLLLERDPPTLLSHLTLPYLRTLSLGAPTPAHPSVWPGPALHSFLLRSNCALQVLILSHVNLPEDETISILYEIPDLRVLRSLESAGRHAVGHKVIREMWKTPPTSKAALLPALEELHVSAAAFPPSDFVYLLSARWWPTSDATIPAGARIRGPGPEAIPKDPRGLGVPPLAIIRVEFQGLVDEAARTRFRGVKTVGCDIEVYWQAGGVVVGLD